MYDLANLCPHFFTHYYLWCVFARHGIFGENKSFSSHWQLIDEWGNSRKKDLFFLKIIMLDASTITLNIYFIVFTFSAHDVNLFGLFCFVFTNRKIFPSFKQVPPTCECAKHKVIEMREKLQKSNNVQKALVCWCWRVDLTTNLADRHQFSIGWNYWKKYHRTMTSHIAFRKCILGAKLGLFS